MRVSSLLDLLYPPRCPFCRRLVTAQKPCKCQEYLPVTSGDTALKHIKGGLDCAAPLYYEGLVRDSLLRYKFKGAAAYSKIYASMLAKCIDENRFSCDIITWVPLSRMRLRMRGYDQARLLAEGVSEATGISCMALLRKCRNTRPQSSINDAARRRKNAAGAYVCIAPEKLSGKRVLLIDDIVTTGATLSECSGLLRASGASAVCAAAVARARD